MRKRVKTETDKLRDRADELAKRMVRNRNRCEVAGLDERVCKGHLSWCHILTRDNFRLRWELWNALCMCSGHHAYYTYHMWEWQELIRTFFPEQYALIEQFRKEPWDKDYQATIIKLEEIWKSLKD